MRWSSGDANVTNPVYFWKEAAELAAAAVLAANPKLLIFVEGSNGNYDGIENSNLAMNWGENFQPEAYKPLNIPADKLVLSAAQLRPGRVHEALVQRCRTSRPTCRRTGTRCSASSAPAHAVVIGEFGGYYGTGPTGQMDVTWQNAFVQYLQGKGHPQQLLLVLHAQQRRHRRHPRRQPERAPGQDGPVARALGNGAVRLAQVPSSLRRRGPRSTTSRRCS